MAVLCCAARPRNKHARIKVPQSSTNVHYKLSRSDLDPMMEFGRGPMPRGREEKF